jgi:hypothetical protein
MKKKEQDKKTGHFSQANKINTFLVAKSRAKLILELGFE